MNSGKSILNIPLDRIDEGIDLCLENASQFCSDADVLIGQKSCEHALGFCILATEELGKAIMLKVQSAYARKRSEETVIFERAKPEDYFKATKREDLKKFGFKNLERKINPFYDHLSKLLCAKNMLSLATHERIMLSLEGKWFQTIDEIMDKAKELRKQAQEVSTDLREQVLYVDYNQRQGKWSKGIIQIDSAKVKEFISDVQKAVRLIAS